MNVNAVETLILEPLITASKKEPVSLASIAIGSIKNTSNDLIVLTTGLSVSQSLVTSLTGTLCPISAFAASVASVLSYSRYNLFPLSGSSSNVAAISSLNSNFDPSSDTVKFSLATEYSVSPMKYL